MRAGWQKLHIESMAEIEKAVRSPTTKLDDVRNLHTSLAASSEALGREFDWHALLPVDAQRIVSTASRAEDYLPQDPQEEAARCRNGSRTTPRGYRPTTNSPEAWQAADVQPSEHR